MNLTITQDNTRTETINSSIIDKLYEIAFAASSDPNSTVSLTGRLESPKGYKFKIDWLNTNFSPDLTITVPSSGLYILFTDPEVLNVLKTSIGDGEGVAESALTSTTTTNSLGLANNTSITDFREGCLFTEINNSSTSFVNGCTSLTTLGIPPAITYAPSGLIGNAPISKFIIKNWNNWINTEWNGTNFTAVSRGYLFYDMDNAGNISLITHLVLPEGCNFNTGANVDKRRAFRGSGLQEVTLPTSMTNVGVFENSSLKYLHFANGAEPTSINERAFSNCTNLEFDVSNLPTSITTLGYHCFYGCSKITGSINLPNLTSLASEAFRGSGISGVTDLGSVITSISSCLFFGCSNLTSVVLPSSCTSLGGDCFAGCPLTSISDLSNITTFGGLVFNSLTNLTIPASLLSNMLTAGLRAFRLCNVTGTLNCPNLTLLGNNSFHGCTGLTAVSSLGRVTAIPNECFNGCTSLTSVILPSSCTGIGELAFYNNSALTNINLNNITSVGNKAFFGSGITLLDVSNMTTIGTFAFSNSAITNLILPASKANSISDFSFCAGCNNLTTVTTNVEDWTQPFRCPACPNLIPFVIYQPLITSVTGSGMFGAEYVINGWKYGKNLWTQVYWPNVTNILGKYIYYYGLSNNKGLFSAAYTSVSMDLFYLKDITTIDCASFCNKTVVNAFVVNNTTPPAIKWHPKETLSPLTDKAHFLDENYEGNIATTKLNIYVPDSAISAYLTAWSGHSSKIFGISQLNGGIIYATEADWTTAGKPVGLIAEYLGLSSADLATFMTANNLTYWTNPNA